MAEKIEESTQNEEQMKRESEWEVLELPSTKRQPPPLPVCLGEDAAQWLRKRKVMRDIVLFAGKDGVGISGGDFEMSMPVRHSVKILVVYSFMIIACALVANVGLWLAGGISQSPRKNLNMVLAKAGAGAGAIRTQNMFILRGRSLSFVREGGGRSRSKRRRRRRIKRLRPVAPKFNVSKYSAWKPWPSARVASYISSSLKFGPLGDTRPAGNNSERGNHAKDSSKALFRVDPVRRHYNVRHNMSLVIPLGAWQLEMEAKRSSQSHIFRATIGTCAKNCWSVPRRNISAASAKMVAKAVAEVDGALHRIANADLALAQRLLLENATHAISPSICETSATARRHGVGGASVVANLSVAVPIRAGIFRHRMNIRAPSCRRREMSSIKYMPYHAFSSRWLPDVKRLVSSARVMREASEHANAALLLKKARKSESKARKASVEVIQQRRAVHLLRRSIRSLKRKVEGIIFRGFVRRNRDRLRVANPRMSRKELYFELVSAWEALPAYERDPTAFIESRLGSLRKSLRAAESKTEVAESRAAHLARRAMQVRIEASAAARRHA